MFEVPCSFPLCNQSPSLHLQAASTPVAPVGSPVGSSLSLIPEDGLPPILISTGVKGGTGGHITGACPHPHHSAASSLPAAALFLFLFACSLFFICHRSLIATALWGGRRDVLFSAKCHLDHHFSFFLILKSPNVSYPQFPSVVLVLNLT